MSRSEGGGPVSSSSTATRSASGESRSTRTTPAGSGTGAPRAGVSTHSGTAGWHERWARTSARARGSWRSRASTIASAPAASGHGSPCSAGHRGPGPGHTATWKPASRTASSARHGARRLDEDAPAIVVAAGPDRVGVGVSPSARITSRSEAMPGGLSARRTNAAPIVFRPARRRSSAGSCPRRPTPARHLQARRRANARRGHARTLGAGTTTPGAKVPGGGGTSTLGRRRSRAHALSWTTRWREISDDGDEAGAGRGRAVGAAAAVRLAPLARMALAVRDPPVRADHAGRAIRGRKRVGRRGRDAGARSRQGRRHPGRGREAADPGGAQPGDEGGGEGPLPQRVPRREPLAHAAVADGSDRSGREDDLQGRDPEVRVPIDRKAAEAKTVPIQRA